jgi:uncharacterized protein
VRQSRGAAALPALPRLGVGLSFQPSLLPFTLEREGCDFVEVIPDTLWRPPNTIDGELDEGESGMFAEAGELLRNLSAHKPLVVHSIGLSIGTADTFDTAHVRRIASWRRRFAFPWHSDHLSFNRFEEPSGHSLDSGLTIPVPYDESVLEMVCERVDYVLRQVPVPFLLENNVYYFEIPEQDMSEPEFLNELSARSGCGLLLDIHNVYVNATNHGFDGWQFIEAIDLDRVVEVHIAGGLTVEGTYLDAHSGPCPEPVWTWLAELVPRAPQLRGVTFEILDSYVPELGVGALRAELARARSLFPA